MKALILSVLFITSVAQAVPTKFSKCEESVKVKHPNNSSGVFFNEDCSHMYVLPPQKGTIEFNEFKPTGYQNHTCEQFENLDHAITSSTSSLNSMTKRIDSYQKRILDIEEMLYEQGMIPVGDTVESVEAKLDKLIEREAGAQDSFNNVLSKLIANKKELASFEGGQSKFLITNSYNQLVNEYQSLNPNMVVHRMPMEQSYLTINEKAADVNSILSAVLSIELPAAKSIPLLQSFREGKQPEGYSPSNSPGALFSDALSGNVSLSGLGACPVYKEGGDYQKSLKNYVVANGVYQYHVQVRRKHTIKFNLAQLAKRIEKSQRKGGFLSRKNIHSVIEESKSESWIQFETYEEDASHTYAEEYKQTIKREFLQRVLEQVAYVDFDKPGVYPSIVEPTGKSGVQAAADALGKCHHKYCQIGMMGLKVIDSAFGKTEAISEFIKTRDFWDTETVDQTKMVPYVGSYTFE